MDETLERFKELRQQYPIVRYDSFEVERKLSGSIFRFRFSVPPDIFFAPEVTFESDTGAWDSVGEEFLHNAAFHLGLIELFSYWKATSSPVIEIRAGDMTREQ